MLLIFGLLVTALLGVTFYQAGQARLQTRRAERAEQERRKANLHRFYLASIVDSSDDAIIGKDLDGTILSWNRGAEKLYGYSAQEMIGQSISILCPPDLSNEPHEVLERIKHGEKVEHYETERVGKAGQRIQTSLTVSPILDPDGRITGASTIARDITDRKRAQEALKASEALLRNVIDSSTDFIFVKDRELRIILCNQAYAQALGKSVADITGRFDTELGWERELVEGNPAKGIKGWEQDDRAALNGETVQIAAEPCNVAGEIHYFDTVKAPFRPAQGEIAGLVGVSRDITERKKTEQRLRETEQNYKTLFDSINEGFCTIEVLFDEKNKAVDFRYLDVSPSFERQSGIPDARGRTIRQIAPQLEESWFEFYGRIALTGEPARFEMAAQQLGRWYDVYAFRVGEPAQRRVAALFYDITERKRTEHELHQASTYNRSLIEASLDPLVTIASDGSITDVNQATEQATGLSRQALIGTDFCDYFTDPKRARAGYQLVFQQGWTQDYELELRHRDGSIRPVVYNASLYRNEAGETVGVFAAARDITERKRAEREVKELNASLERRVAERTAELLAVNQELEAFNYSVSHDLRAPLRHIDGYSTILLADYCAALPDDGRTCMNRIRDEAQRMGRMVDELLDLSRISRRELSNQLTGLGTLVAEVLGELAPDLQGRQIDWRIGELPFADCDPVLMRLVFANLLGNAVKFTRGRKLAVIEVGQTRAEGQTVLFVRDNGVGFSMKYADKLFGVFQRLHRREDFEGSGVGLVTVQRIIHKHGGRIWAEAELDKGATFYFTLGPTGPPQLEESSGEPKAVLTGER